MISHPAQSSNEIRSLNKRLVTLKLLQEDRNNISRYRYREGLSEKYLNLGKQFQK